MIDKFQKGMYSNIGHCKVLKIRCMIGNSMMKTSRIHIQKRKADRSLERDKFQTDRLKYMFCYKVLEGFDSSYTRSGMSNLDSWADRGGILQYSIGKFLPGTVECIDYCKVHKDTGKSHIGWGKGHNRSCK